MSEPTVLAEAYVQGLWLCLDCRAQIADDGAKPASCASCGGWKVVPMTWNRYGPQLLEIVEASNLEAAAAEKEAAVVGLQVRELQGVVLAMEQVGIAATLNVQRLRRLCTGLIVAVAVLAGTLAGLVIRGF